MSEEMTPKDSLKQLNNFISREKHIDSERNKTINKCVNTLNQALDRLEQLEKENQNWKEKATSFRKGNIGYCKKVIELENQIKKLEKENQNLRNKLNINFEDCADELCKALTQRDKLYDENLELQKENQELENKNAALKIKVRAWEIQGKKYKKAIEILKEKADIRLHSLNNTDGSKIYEIEFILGYYSTIYDITQKEYDLLKEFLE